MVDYTSAISGRTKVGGVPIPTKTYKSYEGSAGRGFTSIPIGARPGGYTTGGGPATVRPQPKPAPAPKPSASAPPKQEIVRRAEVSGPAGNRTLVRFGAIGPASKFESWNLQEGERIVSSETYGFTGSTSKSEREQIRNYLSKTKKERQKIDEQEAKRISESNTALIGVSMKQPDFVNEISRYEKSGLSIRPLAEPVPVPLKESLAGGRLTRQLTEREATRGYITGLTGVVARSEIEKAPQILARKEEAIKTTSKDIAKIGDQIFKKTVSVTAPSMSDVDKGFRQLSERPTAAKPQYRQQGIAEITTSEQAFEAQRFGTQFLGGAAEAAVTFIPSIPVSIEQTVSRPIETATGTVEYAVTQPGRFAGGVAATSVIGAGIAKSVKAVKSKLSPARAVTEKTITIKPKPEPKVSVTYSVEDIASTRQGKLIIERGRTITEIAPEGYNKPSFQQTLTGETELMRIPKGLKTIKQRTEFQTITKQVGDKFVSDIAAAKAVETPKGVKLTGEVARAVTEKKPTGILETKIRAGEVKPGAAYGPQKIPETRLTARKITTTVSKKTPGLEKFVAETGTRKEIPFRGTLSRTIESGQRKTITKLRKDGITFERSISGELGKQFEASLKGNPIKIEIKAGPSSKPATITKLARDVKLEQAARAARPIPESFPKPTITAPTRARPVTVRPITSFTKVPKPSGLPAQAGAALAFPTVLGGVGSYPSRIPGMANKIKEPPGRFGKLPRPPDTGIRLSQGRGLTIKQAKKQIDKQSQKSLQRLTGKQKQPTTRRFSRTPQIGRRQQPRDIQRQVPEQRRVIIPGLSSTTSQKQRQSQRQRQRWPPVPVPVFTPDKFPRPIPTPQPFIKALPSVSVEEEKTVGPRKIIRRGGFVFSLKKFRIRTPSMVARV